MTSSLGQAAEACLVTLGGAEQASTRRTYGRILRRVVAEFGAETALNSGMDVEMTPGMALEDSWI